MATSAQWALPVPSLSDPPNGPAQLLALANAIETAVAGRYVPLAGGVLLTDTAQAITTVTFTNITWTDAEVSDPDGWCPAGSHLLTVPAGKAGRYCITYYGSWSTDPGAIAGAICLVNGTAGYQSGAKNTLVTDYTNTVTFIRTLVVGDTLQVQVYQNSGSSRNTTSRLEIAPV